MQAIVLWDQQVFSVSVLCIGASGAGGYNAQGPSGGNSSFGSEVIAGGGGGG